MIPLELKCPAGKTQVGYLRGGVIPTDYQLQVAMQMVCLNARTGYFMSYHPNYAPLIVEMQWSELHDKLRYTCVQFAEYIDEICQEHNWPRKPVAQLGYVGEPEIIDCDQRSGVWYEARLGIPTASGARKFMKLDGAMSGSKTMESYANELINERVRGVQEEIPMSFWMERGQQLEPQARAAFSLITGKDVAEIGFVRNYGVGSSPDGVIT